MRFILILAVISILGFSSLAVSSVALAGGNIGGESLARQTEDRISLADAKKGYDDGTVIMVDARGADSFKAEHIKGAINVPAEEAEKFYKKIPKDKKIVTYCSCPAEQTSLYLVGKLKEHNITSYALIGGNRAWKEAGYPMESGK